MPAQLSSVGRSWRCLAKKYCSVWSNSIVHRVLSLRGLKDGGNTFGPPPVVWGKKGFEQLDQKVAEHRGFPNPAYLGPGIPSQSGLQMVQHLKQISSGCRVLPKPWGWYCWTGFWRFPKKPGWSSAMPHKQNARTSERISGLHHVLSGYGSILSGLSGDQWNEGDVPVLWFMVRPSGRFRHWWSAWSLADGFKWNGFRRNCTPNGNWKEPALCLFHRTFDGIRQAGRGSWRYSSCDPGTYPQLEDFGIIRNPSPVELAWAGWGWKGSAYQRNFRLLDSLQPARNAGTGTAICRKTFVESDVFRNRKVWNLSSPLTSPSFLTNKAFWIHRMKPGHHPFFSSWVHVCFPLCILEKHAHPQTSKRFLRFKEFRMGSFLRGMIFVAG